MNRLFFIFQNSLKDLHDEVNLLGWTEAENRYSKVRTHLACSLRGSKGYEPRMFKDYEKVGWVLAKDLDDVFEAGNIGHERITEFTRMHSISVGDIIFDDWGRYFMVDPWGFTEISINR